MYSSSVGETQNRVYEDIPINTSVGQTQNFHGPVVHVRKNIYICIPFSPSVWRARKYMTSSYGYRNMNQKYLLITMTQQLMELYRPM